MGRIPQKPRKMSPNEHELYDKINNLLSNTVKSEIQRMKEDLDQSKKELKNSADEMKRDVEKVRQDIRNQLVQKRASAPMPPPDRNYDSPFKGTTLYDAFYTESMKAKPTRYNQSTKKKEQMPVIDKTTVNDDITTYTPATHNVKITTRVTSQDRENGTRKIIGMETVEWWEYVLIYGFFKATKIAYEYNIVKDLIKNPEHIVSLINKGVVVLTFIPKNNVKQVIDKFEGKEFLKKTGTVCREFQLTIEIPYVKGTKKQEVKKGFFLYEETYETIEADYEALGKKIGQELDDKKINEGFKQVIANEINNGRISRV